MAINEQNSLLLDITKIKTQEDFSNWLKSLLLEVKANKEEYSQEQILIDYLKEMYRWSEFEAPGACAKIGLRIENEIVCWQFLALALLTNYPESANCD